GVDRRCDRLEAVALDRHVVHVEHLDPVGRDPLERVVPDHHTVHVVDPHPVPQRLGTQPPGPGRREMVRSWMRLPSRTTPRAVSSVTSFGEMSLPARASCETSTSSTVSRTRKPSIRKFELPCALMPASVARLGSADSIVTGDDGCRPLTSSRE